MRSSRQDVDGRMDADAGLDLFLGTSVYGMVTVIEALHRPLLSGAPRSTKRW
jgi:hypothetical protein